MSKETISRAKKMVPDEDVRAKVFRLRKRGMLKTDIAKRVGMKVIYLRRLYDKELIKGRKIAKRREHKAMVEAREARKQATEAAREAAKSAKREAIAARQAKANAQREKEQQAKDAERAVRKAEFGLAGAKEYRENYNPDAKYIFRVVPPENCGIPLEVMERYADRISRFDKNGMPVDNRGNVVVGKKDLEFYGSIKTYKDTPWKMLIDGTEGYKKVKLSQEPWDLSLPDWEERILDKKIMARGTGALIPQGIPLDLVRPAYKLLELPEDHKFKVSDRFNIELAQRAILAFNRLKLADVDDTPSLDVAGADWFRDIVAIIFGSYDPATKSRMVREVFLLVPKKNNKTTGGALLMLLIMIFNKRPNGRALMTAPLNEVAKVAFDAISGAIALDPALSGRFMVKEHKQQIQCKETKSKLQVITFDPKALTGRKLFAALIDEIHVLAKNPKADRAIRQIRGGMVPFPESILIFITTQSEEAPAGVFRSELHAARSVRDGKRKTARLLPILYEFPASFQQDKDKKWRDPTYWPLVTPNVGKSIAVKDLVSLFEDAESKGEAEMRAWASQHLNIEIGLALRSDAWVGAAKWEARKCDLFTDLKTMLARCEVVTVGIDGGGLDDLLGLSVVGREAGTGNWLAWCKAWVADTVLELRKSEAPLFLDLQKLGDLTIMSEEDMGTDIDELIGIVMECEKAGLLDKVGLDPYGVGLIVDALYANGIEPERVVGISQGWRLGGAIMTTERALAEGKLLHCGQPIMNYCVGNAKVEPRGNAKLITKAASGTAKIDPLMAMFNAIHLIAQNPVSKSKKYQLLVFGGKNQQKAA